MPLASTTPAAVAEALGIEPVRLEPTRSGDEDSLGNGNWHLWTGDDEHFVVRRYHVLRTAADLAYETAVLDHLTARGWCVPAQVAGPIWYDDRLWAVTRFVPGEPHQEETTQQRAERGAVLARLHADLRELDMGQRHVFFEACDLAGLGAFQGWESGVDALRRQRPDLADRSARAMDRAQQLVAEHNLRDLPQIVVHGDFASWNLHFDPDGRLAGIIDFDLCHRDSRAWEFVIARVHRAPEMLTDYQLTATDPLTNEELAAIEPLQVVFRVHMVMAELWDAQQTGHFNLPMIDRQLGLAENRTV
jgi:Ser/Thr protein kinase RdoA (MazF antagonist)